MSRCLPTAAELDFKHWKDDVASRFEAAGCNLSDVSAESLWHAWEDGIEPEDAIEHLGAYTNFSQRVINMQASEILASTPTI